MKSPLFALLVLLSLTHSARADMIAPGYSSVPHHFIFEAAGDYSEYRFFWTWSNAVEPMDIQLGKPFHVDGTNMYMAYIVAIPAKMAEGKSKAQLLELVRLARSSELVDFRGSVPFYDSRRELVSTYLLTFVPGEGIKLDLLSRNEERWWSKACRFAAGIFLCIAIAWAGFRWIRRRRKRPEATSGL